MEAWLLPSVTVPREDFLFPYQFNSYLFVVGLARVPDLQDRSGFLEKSTTWNHGSISVPAPFNNGHCYTLCFTPMVRQIVVVGLPIARG